MKKSSALEIQRGLKALPAWKKKRASIWRKFLFKDFVVAMKFVNKVARLSEKAWHHPDIDIRWNAVTLLLTTHDAGGLTAKDFELAAAFNRLAAALPAPAASS